MSILVFGCQPNFFLTKLLLKEIVVFIVGLLLLKLILIFLPEILIILLTISLIEKDFYGK